MARVTASRKKDTGKFAKKLKNTKNTTSEIFEKLVEQQLDLGAQLKDLQQAAATELKKALVPRKQAETTAKGPKKKTIKFDGSKFVGGVKLVSFFASKKAADKAINATIKVHKAAERGWKKGSVY